MAIETPLWMDPNPSTGVAPEYSARQDRGMIGRLFTEGIEDVQAGNLAVAQRAAGANMTVEVAAGAAYVAGDDVARQGTYRIVVTSTESVTVGAAPASNSRIDLVVLRVRDATAIGGTAHGASIEVIAGVAAASPAAPTVPNTAIPLAQVLVASGATSVVTANITDRRLQAGANKLVAGDFETMTTAQRLALSGAELRIARPIFDSTLGMLFIYGSSGWRSARGTPVKVVTSFQIPASSTFVNPAAPTSYTVPLGAAFRSATVEIKTSYGSFYGSINQLSGDALGIGTSRQYNSNAGVDVSIVQAGVSGASLLYQVGINQQTWWEFLTGVYLNGTNLIVNGNRYFAQGNIPATTVSITLFGEY